MKNIGLFSKKKNESSQVVTKYKMITENGNGFYAWDGRTYQSDIVRACIRPKVKAVGKLVAKHLRNEYEKATGKTNLKINPEPYMRFLLEEPNQYMSMQKMLEKVTTQLCLNNNAFILVIRDDNGYPTELYPLPLRQYIDEATDDTVQKSIALLDGKVVDKNSLVTMTIKNS